MIDREVSGKPLKGWHVLVWLLAFFGVMFAVNGVFVAKAISSFPGESERKSYRQGLDYNATLASRRAQAALGWGMAVGLERDGDAARLLVRVKDADEAPVSGLRLVADLRHGADKASRILELSHLGGGVYAADATDLRRGVWRARVAAQRLGENDVAFEAEKTLIAP